MRSVGLGRPSSSDFVVRQPGFYLGTCKFYFIHILFHKYLQQYLCIHRHIINQLNVGRQKGPEGWHFRSREGDLHPGYAHAL